MNEPVEWQVGGLAPGRPLSPRFGDIYRSEGGLVQARHSFLRGCGLPEAWRGQPQWRVLETGFGLGLNFLACWQAWRADPQRPRLLHYCGIEAYPVSRADLLRSTEAFPELADLAAELVRQWDGLRPGLHRLSFDGGQVLLTLCIGDVKAMLRELDFSADSLFLDGFSPDCNPAMWEVHTLKAVARLCRRGTTVATWCTARVVRDALKQCGFDVKKTEGAPPKRHSLCGQYNPAWEPRNARPAAPMVTPGRCVVVGAGLAGAAVAASLARRGWQVQVLEAAATPAQGASALPVGLAAPHVSPDDAVLSRLSRAGLRVTLAHAQALLRDGEDWAQSGVLERRLDGRLGLPAAVQDEAGKDVVGNGTAGGAESADKAFWSHPASADQLQAAGLPPDDMALWHRTAAWVKPAALVQALLAQPGITWRGNCRVARLQQLDGRWQVLDAAGSTLAEAPLVVVAAAFASQALLASAGATAPLQAIRGQVSWARHAGGQAQGLAPGPAPGQPPFPVNGYGSWIPQVPDALGPFWALGASFERDEASMAPTAGQTRLLHQQNQQRLATLLPTVAAQLVAQDTALPAWQAFVGIRCAAPDRLPLVGPVKEGLWLSTAMGSRGLTFALLCAELLAARLHGEPLPLEKRLAGALDVTGRRLQLAAGSDGGQP